MDTAETKNMDDNKIIDELFTAGAHFGYIKSRRHPTSKEFIFGVKNKVEIFDLTKTAPKLIEAEKYVTELARLGQNILFVGGKSEAREIIKDSAESINMPYVSGRWVGGTLSNFTEIKKRISRLETLTLQKEKGELIKYTKKERLLIDKEIERLRTLFSGLQGMKEIPKAIFVVDSKKEKIAVKEAGDKNIVTIGLSGTDCDHKEVDYSIPGNDSSKQSIKFFVERIRDAYRKGLTLKV